MQLEDLANQLTSHEHASQRRYEDLHEHVKERTMGLDNVTDKVNINLGGGDGGGGGGSAAMIAALLNGRNQDGNMAAMLPLLAGAGGGLGGSNALWPIILLALLGRGGRGGLFGGDGGDCAGGGGAVNQITENLILQKLGDIQGSIPLASAQTENVILQQTNAITNLASQAQLANAAGFAATKDAVQNSGVINLQATNAVGTAVQTSALQTVLAIGNDGDKTRALIQSINDANLQRQLAVAENALAEERTSRRVRDVEVNVTQQVTQNQAQLQAQAQQQQQFALLNDCLRGVVGELQVARATNANLIIGNTGATTTGAQTASPINVRS